MSDPRRLLDDGGTPFERSLLGALASERPPPELERRMRQGLVVAGVAGTTAKVAAAGFGKVVAVGLVGAGLALGYVALEHRRVELPPRAAPAKLAPVVAAKPSAEPVVSALPAPPEAPASAAARPRPLAPPGDLREEIRLLDQARAAVRSGDHRRALRLLASYDQSYPRGQFRQEVQVLRVEALEGSGNARAARALGQKFLAEHPESPHVERVESVTGSGR